MQDFIQEAIIAAQVIPASHSAATPDEWINMENHRYATFIVITGTVSGNTKMKIEQATNASGGTTGDVAHPFVGNVYYTNVGAPTATTMVQTPCASSGSLDVVTIPAATNAIYAVTVDAVQATTAAKPYINFVATNASLSADIVGCVAVLHGTRYQNETGYDVLA